jgi:hypothetical protein
VAKSISRELLINGKIHAKHVSRFRTKIFSPLGVASVTAELNLRESLESGKIYANMTNHLHEVGVGLSNGNMELPYLTRIPEKLLCTDYRNLRVNQEIVGGLLTKTSKY